MTANVPHPAAPTWPRRLGPPGDVVGELPPVDLDDIQDELDRAAYELLFAAARHRKAWKVARQLRDRIKMEGGWPDGDATYTKATGDVRWWREEMSAQAAAVQALRGLRDDATPPPRATPPAAAAGSPEDLVGATVFGWPVGRTIPTAPQYRHAKAWLEWAAYDGGPHPAMMVRGVETLIEMYEEAHPAAKPQT